MPDLAGDNWNKNLNKLNHGKKIMKYEITVTASHRIKEGDFFEAKWVFIADVRKKKFTRTMYGNVFGSRFAHHMIFVRTSRLISKEVHEETSSYVKYTRCELGGRALHFLCYDDAMLSVSFPKPIEE